MVDFSRMSGKFGKRLLVKSIPPSDDWFQYAGVQSSSIGIDCSASRVKRVDTVVVLTYGLFQIDVSLSKLG